MLNAACEQCRSRKVRCDGLEPCTPCIKSGRKQECSRRSRKKRTPKKEMIARRIKAEQDRKHDEENSKMDTEEDEQDDGDEKEGQSEAQSFGAQPFWPSASTYVGMPKVDREEPLAFSPAAVSPATALSLDEVQRLTSIAEQARALLGSEAAARSVIVYSYFWRVSSSVHSCVHIPTALRLLKRLFDENDKNVAQNIPSAHVNVLLMIVSLGIRAFPRYNLVVPHRLKDRYSLIRKTYSNMPTHARSIAHVVRKNVLQDIVTGGRSLQHMQSICLLLTFDVDGSNSNEQLFDHAVRTMRRWPFEQSSTSVGGVEGTIEQEMAVRVWWSLVCRDWMGAVSSGTYSIQASHFACRLPSDLNDEQLEGKAVHVQPYSSSHTLTTKDYVPIRWSFIMIQFAQMIRRLVDVRIAKTLDLPSFSNEVVREFEIFCINLPDTHSMQRSRTSMPYAAMARLEHDSRLDPIDGKLTTERWVIHQHIFYALLELHSPITMLAPSRIAIPLAQHILDTRRDIEDLCSVTDLFRFKFTNAINACVVLLLHLIQSHREGTLTFIGRDLILRKVRATLHQDVKQYMDKHAEAFALVTELVRLEGQAWTEHPLTLSNNASGPQQNSISNTILNATQSWQGPTTTTKTPTSSSTAPSSINGEDLALFPHHTSVAASSPGGSWTSIDGGGSVQGDNNTQKEQQPDFDWLASLPSDVAVSPMFQPHAEDPNGVKFYDSIRSTLLWTEGVVEVS